MRSYVREQKWKIKRHIRTVKEREFEKVIKKTDIKMKTQRSGDNFDKNKWLNIPFLILRVSENDSSGIWI